MSALTVGSMFSGIGGLDLGLERAGMEVKYFVEKDKYAQLVLKKHWPGVPIYDDIITLRTDELPTVDIIAGGPPCQDFSVAGKRKGLEGSRGILSIVYWQKISEIRPKYVIMENVTGILDKGLLSVLGEAALCGYDAEWNTISACSVGAFHRRDRIFLIGIRSDIYDKWSERGGGEKSPQLSAIPLNVQDSNREPMERNRTDRLQEFDPPLKNKTGRAGERDDREAMADTIRSMAVVPHGCGALIEGSEEPSGWSENTIQHRRRCSVRRNEGGRVFIRGPARSSYWTPFESDVGGTADGIPEGMDGAADWERGVPRIKENTWDRADRLRCLGNAVVPQVAEYVGRCVIEFDRKVRGE